MAELAARLAQGDADVLRDVLLLLGPPTERMVRKRLAGLLSEADCEDALSIALFRLWRRRDRFDSSRARLDRWFYVLVRNAAIDLLRHKNRQPEQALGDEAERIPQPPGDVPPEQPSRLRRDLLQALDRVSAVDRQILLSGRTETELSLELHLNPGTIRVRRLRTKEKLRSVLRDMGHVIQKP